MNQTQVMNNPIQYSGTPSPSPSIEDIIEFHLRGHIKDHIKDYISSDFPSIIDSYLIRERVLTNMNSMYYQQNLSYQIDDIINTMLTSYTYKQYIDYSIYGISSSIQCVVYGGCYSATPTNTIVGLSIGIPLCLGSTLSYLYNRKRYNEMVDKLKSIKFVSSDSAAVPPPPVM